MRKVYKLTMFAKLFSRITDSSLMEEPIPVRYTFVMLLAVADQEGIVVGTDVALARRLNMPLAEFQSCLAALMEPDPDSNSRDFEGRRIVKSEGERGLQVVNYVKYRNLKTEDDKREYMRNYMRKYRQPEQVTEGCKTCKIGKENVKVLSVSASESESSKERGTGETVALASKHPTLDEIKLVTAKAGLPDSDADYFFNHWQANGWTNSGKPMKSWPHVIGSWKAAGHLPSQKPNGRPVKIAGQLPFHDEPAGGHL
jgi:hypothetical protein